MIEIHANPLYDRVVIHCLIKMGPSIANTRAYWLGWDRPAEIWRAMEEAVTSFICTGINLVTSDGETIMQVPDFANRALIQELKHLKSEGWNLNEAEVQKLVGDGWTDESAQGIYQSARTLAIMTEAKRCADKLIDDEIRKASAKRESPHA